jgi:hypothetical protein
MSEDDVSEVIASSPVLKHPENWKAYGNNPGNFGTFENQQNNPIPALVEKITNSIDAILLKECKKRGIDTKSKEAPRSMSEAVEIFFGIKNGDFSEVIKSKRREIAESIQVISVGEKATPSILIYDDGEGQEPINFIDTFLSLQRNNKTNIKFVQGKYNMGSTGAVVFCGEKKYQLIASKRNTSLTNETDTDFGFTLVRRHPLSRQEEANGDISYYEYFCIDNKIPSFPIDEIDLGLFGRKFKTGSIVKLYSYELPRGSKSDITLDLSRDLNQYLYHPAIPFLIFENREGFKSGEKERGRTPTKPILGNKTRISLDDRDKVQQVISYSIDEPNTLGEIPLEVVVFKSSDSQRDFIGNKSIIFTQNGQVHGFYGRSFVSKDLNLPLLKDCLLIHVDCTKIHTSYRQDLFMGNRTQLKEGTDKTQYLLDRIIEILKKSETLKQLNQERKNLLLRDSKEDKELIESIISKLPVDKDLTKLLLKDGSFPFFKQIGDKFINQQLNNELKTKEKENTPKLNRFPSIFNIDLKESSDGRKLKTIPINSHGIIKIKTDVVNDYLYRPTDKGSLKIHILQKRKKGINPPPPPPPEPHPDDVEDTITVEREGPIDGTIKFLIKPKHVLVGDEIEVKVDLSAPGNELECIFWVKVVDPIDKVENNRENRNETFPQLPKPQKVFKVKQAETDRDWTNYNWGGDDIVKIIESSDGNNNLVEAIAINMDSFALQRFISKNHLKSEKEISFIKDKYFLSVYLHALFMYGIFHKVSKNGFEEQFKNIDISELITSIFRPYAAFLLYENYHLENKVLEDL